MRNTTTPYEEATGPARGEGNGREWRTVGELAAAGMRAHLYVTRSGIFGFVTRDGLRGLLPPAPAGRIRTPRPAGSNGNGAARPERTRGRRRLVPAPCAGQGRRLVATGTGAKLALTAAVDGAPLTGAEPLRRLAAECGVDAAGALRVYGTVIGANPPAENVAALERALEERTGDGEGGGGDGTEPPAEDAGGGEREPEKGGEERRGRSLLADCAIDVLRGTEHPRIYRFAVHGYPRAYHGAGSEERRRMAETEPLRTETDYDALFAAVAEHCARLAGERVPAWCAEPWRFLDVPHIDAKSVTQRLECLHRCPPAFLRHGYLIDPESLDERGGERHAWGSPR